MSSKCSSSSPFREATLADLCRRRLTACIDKCRADHTESLKTLELYFINHIIFHRSLVSSFGRDLLASHILMGLFKITGIWCMSCDWQGIFLHFAFSAWLYYCEWFHTEYYFLILGPFCSQTLICALSDFPHSFSAHLHLLRRRRIQFSHVRLGQ